MVGGPGDDQSGTGDIHLLLRTRVKEAEDLEASLEHPNLTGDDLEPSLRRLRHLREGIIPDLERSL
ncbi:MAG: hypothetical protein Greene071421_307 [Parcubacteria group bacterium Greene0714_21]|nr:MAG: hypothetical protein Greene101447_578 [Parcubacteria group bacterium Greene1014_47]TSD04145.1 MAG: hypothetical protein Greene071421_307 [Parcubacteria group bacterium Greene0714_21]